MSDHEMIEFQGQLIPILGSVGGSKEESAETARNIEAWIKSLPGAEGETPLKSQARTPALRRKRKC